MGARRAAALAQLEMQIAGAETAEQLDALELQMPAVMAGASSVGEAGGPHDSEAERPWRKMRRKGAKSANDVLAALTSLTEGMSAPQLTGEGDDRVDEDPYL